MSWGHGIAWAVLLSFATFMFWYDEQPHVVEEREANNANHFVNSLEENLRYLRDTSTGDCFAYLSSAHGVALTHIPCRYRANMIEFVSQ